jgi:hypothetical protein
MELRAHVLLQVDPGWSQQAAAYVAALCSPCDEASQRRPNGSLSTGQYAHGAPGVKAV